MYERCIVGDSCRQVALEERGIERLRWRRGVERGSVGGEGYREVALEERVTGKYASGA